MTPYLDDGDVTVYHGDCLEVMAGMDEASVDAIVCDPPYGLEFMGKEWDRPWAVGFSDTGYTDGKRIARPSFGSNRNPVCRQCRKHQRGKAGCVCPKPDFDERPADSSVLFGQWCETWGREALRVLKPGGHLLAFGGTRTYHRLTCGLEDAGFEIRDSLSWSHMRTVFCQCSPLPDDTDGSGASPGPQRSEQRAGEPGDVAVEWIAQGGGAWPGCPRCHLPLAPPFDAGPLAWYYGSGFPKSLDVGKAIDKAAGAEREVVGYRESMGYPDGGTAYESNRKAGSSIGADLGPGGPPITAPATPEAAQWEGWGTALKPAHEPVVLARKPLVGTVAACVLEHGTGALNIAACRVEHASEADRAAATPQGRVTSKVTTIGATPDAGRDLDRVEFDRPDTAGGRWPANVVLDEQAAEMLDEQTAGRRSSRPSATGSGWEGSGAFPIENDAPVSYIDTGGASRFFYTAKADATERNGSTHPTVKPLDLMRWLVRLVTPPGGLILDPFAGSGTTLEAARAEGFRAVGIEREGEYLPDIARRLQQLSLLGGAHG